MTDEYCPECGAKITSKTGFCSNCGAITTSLNNQIKERKKIENKEKKTENNRKWYHKPNKSHIKALIYSIVLPFSGNLYLRENIINLILTILSVLIMVYTINGLLTISDFYYRNPHIITILIIYWFISLISLIFFIVNYKSREDYYIENEEKYSKKSEIPTVFTKKYLKFIPFILIILFLIVNIAVLYDNSPKIVDTADISFQYPHEYQSNGNWKKMTYSAIYRDDEQLSLYYGDEGSRRIIIHKLSTIETIDDVVNSTLNSNNESNIIDKGAVICDGVTGHIFKFDDKYEKTTLVVFINNNNLYYFYFYGDSEKDMDMILNSLKFK